MSNLIPSPEANDEFLNALILDSIDKEIGKTLLKLNETTVPEPTTTNLYISDYGYCEYVDFIYDVFNRVEPDWNKYCNRVEFMIYHICVLGYQIYVRGHEKEFKTQIDMPNHMYPKCLDIYFDQLGVFTDSNGDKINCAYRGLSCVNVSVIRLLRLITFANYNPTPNEYQEEEFQYPNIDNEVDDLKTRRLTALIREKRFQDNKMILIKHGLETFGKLSIEEFYTARLTTDYKDKNDTEIISCILDNVGKSLSKISNKYQMQLTALLPVNQDGVPVKSPSMMVKVTESDTNRATLQCHCPPLPMELACAYLFKYRTPEVDSHGLVDCKYSNNLNYSGEFSINRLDNFEIIVSYFIK